MVVRQGMALSLMGVVAGTVATLGLTKLMSTLLFEVKPDDAGTLACVAVALTATALD
jgi:hypothetical protein